jgi:myosin heavy subunit
MLFYSTGVFQLLDEASLAPVVGHKDFYFCRKVNTTLGQRVKSDSSSLIGGVILEKKSFDLDKEFLIRHYAGDVLYSAENFNFQNLDFLPQDLEICLRCCKNDFISKVLFKEENDYIMEKILQVLIT